MAENNPKVVDLTSSPNPSTSLLRSSPESRKSAPSNLKLKISQLKSKIEWADKAQLCATQCPSSASRSPEAAKLISSILPSPRRATRGRIHPFKFSTLKAPGKQLTTKAVRKTASATKEDVLGDDSEEESRLEKKRGRTWEFCGDDCKIVSESEFDGNCNFSEGC